MYWTSKHCLICTASHCAQRGANDVAGKLRLAIVRRGLDDRILVNNCGSVDLCDIGPNIVIYPDNIILSHVTTADIPAIVDWLAGGEPVPHLVLSPEVAEERTRQHFYARAVAAGPSLPEASFGTLALEFGLDQTWVDEQARRGFIARKPDPDLGVMVTPTKKARTRYGV